MGATRAVNIGREKLRDVMEDLGMTEGFDVGMEMSGVPAAFHDMLAHMNHGGKIALLGIPPPDMAIDWNQVIFKGLEIKGIYGREMFETWYKMVAMLQSGLDLSPIITHHYAVEEFEAAFATMLSGASGKVVLDWTAGGVDARPGAYLSPTAARRGVCAIATWRGFDRDPCGAVEGTDARRDALFCDDETIRRHDDRTDPIPRIRAAGVAPGAGRRIAPARLSPTSRPRSAGRTRCRSRASGLVCETPCRPS